jgi:hypothetical protein
MIFELDEGTAARRRLPFRVFNSDGTSPDTGFSTATVLHSINGGAQVVSANSSSVVSANAGQYYIEFTAAELGTEGTITAFVDAQAADFPQMVGIGYVLNSNPYSSQSNIPLVATVTDVTNNVNANMVQISGDGPAADNLEAMFDGTGYAATASSIGTVDNMGDHSVGTVAHLDNQSVGTVDDVANDAIRALSFTAGAIDATAAPNLDAAITSRLAPTVAARTLDVSAGGAAGVDWANVEGQATEVNLSGTTVDTDVTAISGDATAAINLEAMFDGTGYAATASSIGTVDNLDNSSVGTVSHIDNQSVGTVDDVANNAIRALSFEAGAIDATAVATDAIDADAIADNAINAGAIAADAITAAKVADGTIDAATFAAGAINAAAIATGAIDADAIAADAIGSSELADTAAQKIRDEILPTQNAAFNNIQFLFVDSTDHVTPVTGAGTMAVTRSIDGAAFGAGGGTGPAEIGNGIYQYDASAGDMNGGVITFRFTATTGTPNAPDDTFVTIVTGGGV